MYSALNEDEIHQEFANLNKKDIIDRIIDGDWRRGLSHHQLASIDFAKLEEDDASLRWTALKLVPLEQDESNLMQQYPFKKRRVGCSESRPQLHYPETTIGIFVRNLKHHISPLVKAHYHVHRLDSWRVSIVRLYIQQNVPFAPLSVNVPRQGRAAIETSRCMYIALPDSCPYVYVSLSGSVHTGVQASRSKSVGAKTNLNTTKKIVLEAIPKALSRPQQRWSLEPTKLTVKSLRTVCMLRGSEKVGTTGGLFSQLTQPGMKRKLPPDQIGILSDEHATSDVDSVVPHQSRDALVQSRFGPMTGSNHVGLDLLNVRVGNIFQESKSKKRKRSGDEDNHEAAPMTITLQGSDVFAGLKQLAFAHPEYVNMEKLSAAFSGDSHCSVITL